MLIPCRAATLRRLGHARFVHERTVERHQGDRLHRSYLGHGSAVGSFDAFGSATIPDQDEWPVTSRVPPLRCGRQRPHRLRPGRHPTLAGGEHRRPGRHRPLVQRPPQARPAAHRTALSTSLRPGPVARTPYYARPPNLGQLTGPLSSKDLYTQTARKRSAARSSRSLIPQARPAPVKFFLAPSWRLDDADLHHDHCATSTLHENTPSDAHNAGTIIPFSVANWIAQSTSSPRTRFRPRQRRPRRPNGVAGFTGTGTALGPERHLYNARAYGRDTYLVVEYARIDTTSATYDANPRRSRRTPPSPRSLTNFSAALPSQPGSVKKKYGFWRPPPDRLRRAYPSI